MPPLIIDDINYVQAIHDRLDRLKIPRHNRNLRSPELLGMMERGCKPRAAAYGSLSYAPAADEIIDVIPRHLWPQLIKDGEGKWLHDLCKDHLPPHDQGATNYCWAHGSVRAEEVVRVYEKQPPQILSAESVAVPVTAGRNRGGYPEEALTQLVAAGACRQELWPLNDRDASHATPGWQDDAKRQRITRHLDVDGFEMQMTLALLRIPVAIGLGWWGHLVCQLDPIWFGATDFGIGCDNSWGPDYGENGYFLLTESIGTADLGAFAAVASTFMADVHPKK
jgi:hypothetical protein